MRIPPRRIVMAGGGVRAISHIGALVALHEKNLLCHVKEWIGVSAGAFIATLCSSGFTVPQLKDLSKTVDFTTIHSDEPESVFQFLESFGLDDGSGLERFIEGYLKQKGFDRTSTFQDLYQRTGVGLRMWATELKTRIPVEFSTQKTPTTPVLFALRASMSLPILFTPIREPTTGRILVDGGILGNYPILHLSKKERDAVIGLSFCKGTFQSQEPESIYEFLKIFISVYQANLDKQRDIGDTSTTILSPCGNFPSWKLDITPEDREMLYQTGYAAGLQFLSIKSPKPVRRWSVA